MAPPLAPYGQAVVMSKPGLRLRTAFPLHPVGTLLLWAPLRAQLGVPRAPGARVVAVVSTGPPGWGARACGCEEADRSKKKGIRAQTQNRLVVAEAGVGVGEMGQLLVWFF